MITDIKKYPPFEHKVAPFLHQDQILFTLAKKDAYALFWEMGAGKTKPILDNAAFLFLQREIDGVLVVSDNGAYRNWIDYEVPRHMADAIPYRCAAWSSQMRSKDEDTVNQLLVAKDDCLDILVMNVEAFSAKRAPVFAEAFLRAHYSMMVVDESTSIKNPKAQRTTEILRLAPLAEYRRILTGTPITNNPIDLFSQFEFLKSGILGFTSFVAFRNFFAKLLLVDMGRGRKFYQITGFQNLDYLSKIIKPHSSRILKSECMDLPDKLYETINVEHTPEQAKAYADMRETALTDFEGGMVTATSALVALGKLHQINCGHVKLDEGLEVDIPSNRINVMVETLEKIGQKVIIWAYFHRDIENIMAKLHELYGIRSAVHYYGPTTAEDRIRAIHNFRTDRSCKYFVASPATGGKGISLVEASHVIYFSQSFSLTDRLQSEDRCHRPGQKNKVTYYDMVVPGTIDVKIVRALKMKKDLASKVLDDYRELLTP